MVSDGIMFAEKTIAKDISSRRVFRRNFFPEISFVQSLFAV
jgi:hypothetical protein